MTDIYRIAACASSHRKSSAEAAIKVTSAVGDAAGKKCCYFLATQVDIFCALHRGILKILAVSKRILCGYCLVKYRFFKWSIMRIPF